MSEFQRDWKLLGKIAAVCILMALLGLIIWANT